MSHFRGRALEWTFNQGLLRRHQTGLRYAQILLEDTRASLMGELPTQLHKALH